jgi:hypothetical protein
LIIDLKNKKYIRETHINNETKEQIFSDFGCTCRNNNIYSIFSKQLAKENIEV